MFRRVPKKKIHRNKGTEAAPCPYGYTYQVPLGYHFRFSQKATLTSAMSAGTSTSGPITPANACPELMP